MVDFKKAFNFVNWSIIFYKVIKSGIRGKAMDVLRNMYQKIKVRIKIGSWLYAWLQDESGTSQGGLLSPTMFRDMLNDVK